MTTATPLRMETWVPTPPQHEEIGWFPEQTAKITLWYNSVHLDDLSSWTNVTSAVEAAEEVVATYRIPPSPDGEGMLVAILLAEREVPMQRRGERWEELVERGSRPRAVTVGQRLAWAHTAPGGTMFAAPPLQAFAFERRIPLRGVLPTDSAETLHAALRAELGTLDDDAIVRGVSHQGLQLADVQLQVDLDAAQVPASSSGQRGQRPRDSSIVCARGTARFGLLLLPWAPVEPALPCVDLYPNGDRILWAGHEGESMRWTPAATT